MHTSTLITDDPGAFRLVLETPQGRAWWCADLKRYAMELHSTLPATDQDTEPSRWLWTNTLDIVHQHLGGPKPGTQLDIFTEVEAWSA